MPAATGTNSREFHLGEFVRVLTDTQWVGFTLEITKAHRSPAGTGGMTEAQLKADRGADVVGFRFTGSHTVNGVTRTLADYDMVLYFSIDDGNPDPAFAAEAEAIASYMESGHGFFATGDHANLGSRLCGLIPRVRSMRRWWYPKPGPGGEPVAPDPLNADRHDTTQPGLDGVRNFEDQSDEIAQPIAPTRYPAGLSNALVTRWLPHPLLCSPDGVVKYLPDHMHEGTCEVPGNLATRMFTLAGTPVREYPDHGASGPLAPEIVATGTVVAGTTSPALDAHHTGGTDSAHGTTFGVIAAWDGQRVGKGRVVVDSTWHHFFNINLTGDRYLELDSLPSSQDQKRHGFYVPDGMGGRQPNSQYKMIMWYYRNIIYWLIPANRHRTIWWDTILQFATHSRISEELVAFTRPTSLTLGSYLYLGQLAEDYFAKARGACAIYQFHVIINYLPKIPWWEWVQSHVDIWDPVLRDKGLSERVSNERFFAATGTGPRPDAALRISLGAAVAAAAAARKEHGAEVASVGPKLDDYL
ncbi:MAG TPA: hypothetical protein VF469_36005, partial [Kofleriaceae bacterium]